MTIEIMAGMSIGILIGQEITMYQVGSPGIVGRFWKRLWSMKV